MASKKLDINKARIEDLETLHGIGPAKAKTIIEVRQARGGFKDIRDLLDIKGFGPCLLKRHYDILICNEVQVNNNDRELEDLQFSDKESINKGALETQLQIDHETIKALKSQLDEEIIKNKELQEQLDSIKEKEIQKFSALENELEMKTAELKIVRQELTQANYQLRLGCHGTLMHDKSSEEPGKRRVRGVTVVVECSGLPQNDDDIDVIIMSEEVGIKCPYTQSIMKEPVKNRICKHSYEKCAIEDFIIRRKGHAKCPKVGCGNSKPLNMLDMEPDYKLQQNITENQSKQLVEQSNIIHV